MPDRLAEIRARLVSYYRASSGQMQSAGLSYEALTNWDKNAPQDMDWALGRLEDTRAALRDMVDIAMKCCDGAVGRESVDELLRDYSMTLDEVKGYPDA